MFQINFSELQATLQILKTKLLFLTHIISSYTIIPIEKELIIKYGSIIFGVGDSHTSFIWNKK